MVAATFPNLSFENPPGTGPTLVSGNAEPYSFTEGDLLEFTFAGVTESVIFLASDFGDIGNATAAEVAALLEARVDDLGASADGGFVRLTSLLTGEDVEIDMLGGPANTALGFPLGTVSGETYAGGPPNGWTVIDDTDSVNEWAEWADENGRPEEIFDLEGWIAITVSSSFDDAIFDPLILPKPFEPFDAWSSTGFLTSFIAEAAAFDPDTEPFETFNKGWGLPTYFSFVPANLLNASANPEDFESGWGNPFPVPSFVGADFANGTKTADDFESVVLTFYVVTFVTAAAGLWRIVLNGTSFTYTAGGADTTIDICLALRTAIDTGSVGIESSNLFNLLSLWPTNLDADISIQVIPPPGGSVDTVTARDFPLLAEEWIGQDNNPDFP